MTSGWTKATLKLNKAFIPHSIMNISQQPSPQQTSSLSTNQFSPSAQNSSNESSSSPQPSPIVAPSACSLTTNNPTPPLNDSPPIRTSQVASSTVPSNVNEAEWLNNPQAFASWMSSNSLMPEQTVPEILQQHEQLHQAQQLLQTAIANSKKGSHQPQAHSARQQPYPIPNISQPQPHHHHHHRDVPFQPSPGQSQPSPVSDTRTPLGGGAFAPVHHQPPHHHHQAPPQYTEQPQFAVSSHKDQKQKSPVQHIARNQDQAVYTFLGRLFDPFHQNFREQLETLSDADRLAVQTIMNSMSFAIAKQQYHEHHDYLMQYYRVLLGEKREPLAPGPNSCNIAEAFGQENSLETQPKSSPTTPQNKVEVQATSEGNLKPEANPLPMEVDVKEQSTEQTTEQTAEHITAGTPDTPHTPKQEATQTNSPAPPQLSPLRQTPTPEPHPAPALAMEQLDLCKHGEVVSSTLATNP